MKRGEKGSNLSRTQVIPLRKIWPKILGGSVERKASGGKTTTAAPLQGESSRCSVTSRDCKLGEVAEGRLGED